MTRRIALSAILLAGWLAAATIQTVAAQPADATVSTVVPSRESAVTVVRTDEQRARDWGLKAEEWARYRELMEGPLGVYSPNLDPLTALGIEASSDEEQRRYAELQVQVEGRRVERLLAYQRAYDAAWQRHHPGVSRIGPFDSDAPATAAGVETPGRTAVFVRDPCGPCVDAVQQLQAAGAEFDIYLVGSRGDDQRIRTWAQRVRVDPAKVRSGHITLNHDGGRWLSLGVPGELPAVVVQVDGEWQRRP